MAKTNCAVTKYLESKTQRSDTMGPSINCKLTLKPRFPSEKNATFGEFRVPPKFWTPGQVLTCQRGRWSHDQGGGTGHNSDPGRTGLLRKFYVINPCQPNNHPPNSGFTWFYHMYKDAVRIRTWPFTTFKSPTPGLENGHSCWKVILWNCREAKFLRRVSLVLRRNWESWI